MLKLSNKGIYGIKALYELAKNYGGDPVSLKNITEQHDLPKQFLVQVLSSLRHSGLVVTKRGVNGGYILARPPGRITIGDIVRSLEGPIALCDCLQNTGSKQANERMKQCVTSEIYQRLSVMVESAFDSFTLDDLMKIHVESPAVGTCATLTGN